MYKIYADDTLIYDSTIDDYKISKGSVTLETGNKSGSLTLGLYPDHFYYDRFVRLKTVITVYRSGKILFRGRVLNDTTDYWNNKTLTCEGELNFLRDSITRPFSYTGDPGGLFRRLIEHHNAQVDEFKRFKVGTVTVVDPNGYINRSNAGYESTLTNLTGRLTDSESGGYLRITHGDDGTDPIPTLHYIADYSNTATQIIEFGSNLKNYTKTVKADDIATVIIPLGAEIDDGDENTANVRLTIEAINGGNDYVYDADAVALYGWIVKVVTWDDVTNAENLKRKAETELKSQRLQNITIELNAIDLHLLDRSIESFNIGDYIRVYSPPHNFDSTLLCNKMTIDILKPSNDSLVLGYSYSTFTETNSKLSSSVTSLATIGAAVSKMSSKLSVINTTATDANAKATEATETVKTVSTEYQTLSNKVDTLSGTVSNVETIAAQNTRNITSIRSDISAMDTTLDNHADSIETNAEDIATLKNTVELGAAPMQDNTVEGAYLKYAEIVLQGTANYESVDITLLVRNRVLTTTHQDGILRVRCRYAKATATFTVAQIYWILNNGIAVEDFYLCHNGAEKTVALYVNAAAWEGFVCKQIDAGSSADYIDLRAWTLLNPSVGQEALPSSADGWTTVTSE